ncbi:MULTISPECIES: hypothetical protein [Paenibacillus]|nr:hypothetical protein [Paenibacillus odorifer]OMD11914.1 hypothetical protein BJP47_25665 [Paenibacillus odorifer]OMD17541.1 hypothetical protein BJP50_15560 [Paenibacillus odorifer]OME46084.1 hypothetical protein BSK61_28930 [Paenibacillus odorifer]
MITSAENNALITPSVIRLTDYGVLPDSGLDAQPAMVRAIQIVAEIPGPGLLDCRRAAIISIRTRPSGNLILSRILPARKRTGMSLIQV